MEAGFTQAGADHLHGLVGDDGDERMALGPDGLVVMDRTRAGFGFGERKTAPMPVGVIWVRHRVAPSQSSEWVTIEPDAGRREKRTATACCLDGSVSSAMS